MSHHFELELEGNYAGPLLNVHGGQLITEQLTYPAAPGARPARRSGNVSYEDITIDFGMGMSRAFYDWVKSPFSMTFLRKNGAVNASSTHGRSQMEFLEGFVSGIVLPELDPLSKTPAQMSATVTTEQVRFTHAASSPHIQPPSKKWLASNFKFQIDGLESECKRVQRISALSAVTKVTRYQTGSSRTTQSFPNKTGLSPLVITLPTADIGGFKAWFDTTVSAGRIKERSGSLTYYGPDHKPVLEIHLDGIVIISASRSRANSSQTEVKLSCNSMALAFSPA